MRDFIKIGNRMIRTDKIVRIEYESKWRNWEGQEERRLTIATAEQTPGDYGVQSSYHTYYDNQAESLWNDLQHYMDFTAFTLPEPEPELIEIDGSPTPHYIAVPRVPISDDDQPF